MCGVLCFFRSCNSSAYFGVSQSVSQCRWFRYSCWPSSEELWNRRGSWFVALWEEFGHVTFRTFKCHLTLIHGNRTIFGGLVYNKQCFWCNEIYLYVIHNSHLSSIQHFLVNCNGEDRMKSCQMIAFAQTNDIIWIVDWFHLYLFNANFKNIDCRKSRKFAEIYPNYCVFLIHQYLTKNVLIMEYFHCLSFGKFFQFSIFGCILMTLNCFERMLCSLDQLNFW